MLRENHEVKIETLIRKVKLQEHENKTSLNSLNVDKEPLTNNVNITRRNVDDSISVEDHEKKIHDKVSLNNTNLSSPFDSHSLSLSSLLFEHVKVCFWFAFTFIKWQRDILRNGSNQDGKRT